MFVWVSVYVHLCVYPCMFGFVYLYVCECVCICVVCICVCTWFCVCVCTREASVLWRMKVGGGGREETGGFTIRETGEPKGKELAQGP